MCMGFGICILTGIILFAGVFRAPWLLGYHEEDMLNQSPLIFRHPDERFPLNESMNIRRIMHQRRTLLSRLFVYNRRFVHK